jgi:hypothetical protein
MAFVHAGRPVLARGQTTVRSSAPASPVSETRSQKNLAGIWRRCLDDVATESNHLGSLTLHARTQRDQTKWHRPVCALSKCYARALPLRHEVDNVCGMDIRLAEVVFVVEALYVTVLCICTFTALTQACPRLSGMQP